MQLQLVLANRRPNELERHMKGITPFSVTLFEKWMKLIILWVLSLEMKQGFITLKTNGVTLLERASTTQMQMSYMAWMEFLENAQTGRNKHEIDLRVLLFKAILSHSISYYATMWNICINHLPKTRTTRQPARSAAQSYYPKSKQSVRCSGGWINTILFLWWL